MPTELRGDMFLNRDNYFYKNTWTYICQLPFCFVFQFVDLSVLISSAMNNSKYTSLCFFNHCKEDTLILENSLELRNWTPF